MSVVGYLASPGTGVSTSSGSSGSSTSSSVESTGPRFSSSAAGFWACLPSFTSMSDDDSERGTMTDRRSHSPVTAYPRALRYAAVILAIFLLMVMVGL